MKRIVWTDPAINDLASLRAYIEKDNPGAARKMALRILNAAQDLSAHPNLGRMGRIADTRELVISGTPFIMPYRVKGDLIEVLRILHGAMKWPDAL